MIYIKLCLIANRHGRKILFRRKKQEDTKWNYVTMEHKLSPLSRTF